MSTTSGSSILGQLGKRTGAAPDEDNKDLNRETGDGSGTKVDQSTQDGDPNTRPDPDESQAGSSLGTQNTIEQTGGAVPDPTGFKQAELGNAPEKTNEVNTEATFEQLDAGIVEAPGLASSAPKPVEKEQDFVVTSTMPASATRRGPRAEADVLTAEAGEVDDTPIPVGAYKHRSVRHFKVGHFEFKNHVLLIYTEQANEAFLDLYDGLEPRDQNAIVAYDYEAEAKLNNAQPLMVSRGGLSTRDIKDAKTIQG